ncbi:hypothetical protein [Flavobacterium terrigena]|uniref:PAP2 superfamily protein n=1 Tax=Flavobacterium terrigena TaxID=402734 RepID=A0A1H6VMY7_9FLAO|nr:hypothetical protein [Flavobacterium terrigena]SEJ02050.1 hypothetical protein SAMN05660918_2177 [Flavobacterium terrigena]
MKTKYLLKPFSYIFHPIFISIYGAILYFLFTKNITLLAEVYLSFIQIFILTILLPLCFFMLLKTLKKVKSFTEATIEERRLPIFIQVLLLYCLLNFTILESHFPELYKFFQAGFISSFLVFVSVMMRFKASLHMIGITSLFVFTMMLTSYLEIEATYTLAYLIMCMGFVASSRLYMKAHSPIELIVGMIIGGMPQILIWFYKI